LMSMHGTHAQANGHCRALAAESAAITCFSGSPALAGVDVSQDVSRFTAVSSSTVGLCA
jgi:hypothetical protein